MTIQKINWKFFFRNPGDAQPDEFFKVLNTWIPNSPEVFVDVADYKHVHDGPLTLLYGHYCDFLLDDTDRKRGFAYAYKRVMSGNEEEIITTTLKAFLKGCIRLEASEFKRPVTLCTDKLEFIINDRALAPNNAATFDAVSPRLSKVLAKVYGDGGFTLKHLDDPQKRFGILIEAKSKVSLEEMVTHLG
ncbi:hypothetical protein K1X76_02295 [bacterium]|nr:hypothetical protein [bacterium]